MEVFLKSKDINFKECTKTLNAFFVNSNSCNFISSGLFGLVLAKWIAFLSIFYFFFFSFLFEKSLYIKFWISEYWIYFWSFSYSRSISDLAPCRFIYISWFCNWEMSWILFEELPVLDSLFLSLESESYIFYFYILG
jgi:hypothetical protein